MKSILFVCTGNTCRGPMAEALLRHMLKKAGLQGVDVFSRGISVQDAAPMTKEAQAVLAVQGIDGSAHRSAPLTAADLERADIVFVMEESHKSAIKMRFAKQFFDKIHLLKEYAGDGLPGGREIADPYGGSPEDYEKCKMEIQDSLLSILSTLKKSGGSTP